MTGDRLPAPQGQRMPEVVEPRPPAHIEVWHEVLGTERLIDVLLEFGGADVYFGGQVRTNKLAGFIGQDAYARLAANSHKLPRQMPTAKRWIAQVWRAYGTPVAQIARRLHMSETAVRRYVKEIQAPDPRQGELF